MSLTKLSMAGNNLIIPLFPSGEGFGLVSDIPAGDGKMANYFYSVGVDLIIRQQESVVFFLFILV